MEPPGLDAGLLLFPRESELIFVDGFALNDYEKPRVQYFAGYTYPDWTTPDCRADSLCLKISISSFTPEMFYSAGQELNNFLSNHDQLIEDQIRRYDRAKYGTPGVSVFQYRYYEYRNVACDSFSIISTKKMFGRAAGEDLSDKFEFLGTPRGCELIFSVDKRFAGLIEKGMSVEKYLSFSPLVFPAALLHLKEIPPEAPLEAGVRVNVTLENGRVLSEIINVKIKR